MVLAAHLSPDRLAFYATAATVLPIIMLAFAFQLPAAAIFVGSLSTAPLSVRAARRIVWIVALTALVVAGMMGLAEIEAVASLAAGHSEAYRFVADAMFVAAAVLAVGVIEAMAMQLSTKWAAPWLAAAKAREAAELKNAEADGVDSPAPD